MANESTSERMHFVVFATDRPGCLDLRKRIRPEHRAYLRNPGQSEVRVVLAGPTFEPAGSSMNGTLLIVDAPSPEAVDVFMASDPYSRANLFESIEIRTWTCGMGTYAASEEVREDAPDQSLMPADC